MPNKDMNLGDVFTSSFIVKYMLDLVGYVAERNLSQISVIEPSCGEGAFIIEIIKRLKQSSENFNFPFEKAIKQNLIFFEIDNKKVDICIRKLQKEGFQIPKSIFRVEDFLLSSSSKADIIIGNPPYIRHEKIESLVKVKYKQIFTTFKYKADLYVAFFEKTLSLLNDKGKHCFICSNRWLKNQYGINLRKYISENFMLEKIINMEHTNPFDDTVIAYPAITLISKNKYENRNSIKYAYINEINEINNIRFEEKNIKQNDNWSSLFTSQNERDDLFSITDLGFKIGIGVATGADDIFIINKSNQCIESSLLLPIITTKDITSNGIKWSGNYLFNPFDEKGNIIDLTQYPQAKVYIESHQERLKNRYISRKKSHYWYRTIDKIKIEVLTTPKIILPDISANKYIQIDEGNYYPHHNLYYITSNCIKKLKILSAILMTDFVYKQITSLSSSMNGGYPRWQSQHLKRLKIPNISEWDDTTCDRIVNMYDNKEINKLNTYISNFLL